MHYSIVKQWQPNSPSSVLHHHGVAYTCRVLVVDNASVVYSYSRPFITVVFFSFVTSVTSRSSVCVTWSDRRLDGPITSLRLPRVTQLSWTAATQESAYSTGPVASPPRPPLFYLLTCLATVFWLCHYALACKIRVWAWIECVSVTQVARELYFDLARHGDNNATLTSFITMTT